MLTRSSLIVSYFSSDIEKNYKSSTSWVVQAHGSACSLCEKYGTVQKLLPWAFDFAMIWCIYHWAKPSRLICSYKTQHLYDELVFVVFERETGFASKWILILSAFWASYLVERDFYQWLIVFSKNMQGW